MRSSSGPHLPIACWGEYLPGRHYCVWRESKFFPSACELERLSSGRQIRGAPASLRARRLPAPQIDVYGSMKRTSVLALACFLVFAVAAENRLGSLVRASPALLLGQDGTATSAVVEPQAKNKRLLVTERVDREPGSREKRPTLVSPGTSRSKQQQRQPSKVNLPRHMQETMRPLRTYTFGNIHQTAYYFADVILGTPAVQRQSLILDTGSSVLAFPCTSCKSCGRHMDPPFDCSSSSTCKSLSCSSTCTHCDAKQKRCAYRVSYMEGSSLQGFWHQDQFRLLLPPETTTRHGQTFYDIKNQMVQAQRAQSHSAPSRLLTAPITANFGCHVQETELFVDQKASGIWGLEIWSQFGPETYMTRTLLSSEKSGSSSKLPDGATSFSLCLAEHGGAFSIGDANGDLHTSDMVVSNFIPHQESYSVFLSGIVVGEKEINLGATGSNPGSSNVPQTLRGNALSSSPPREDRPAAPRHTPHPGTKFEVLLDSGTTMSYFPTRLYEDIVKGIEMYAELKGGRRPGGSRRLSGVLTAGHPGAQAGKLIKLETEGVTRSGPHGLMGPPLSSARRLAGTASSFASAEWPNEASDSGDTETSEDTIVFVPRERADAAGAPTSGVVNEEEGIRRASPGEMGLSNTQRRRQERPNSSTGSKDAATRDTLAVPVSKTSGPVASHVSKGKRQQRRQNWRVPVGQEVKDSEAEVVGEIITVLGVDDEEAYELLPPSASPRQSQAVKVESTAGELCFYLPKGRADLVYFPDIWLHFVPPYAGGQGRRQSTQEADEESSGRTTASGWVRWQPASYLYTKGNEHYRCVAMSDDPRSDNSGVLGSSFFIGHDIVFDVRNEVVGIAEANCPAIKLKDRPKELPL
ncbi:eukaryotic aspartyl protease superfamily protein [Cystoisospora suis]|uniref:Eukaryotic aspartyl protease superfamily protein n=1 Tax=Cystoisospora suis TaxID=483139 RepID=A0A2C6L0N0_9APIC|nr:eukaryotic aspartyl protease superfamily protein [Cystoisospora suis]